MAKAVAKPGKTADYAELPSGVKVRPVGEHIFCVAIPLPSGSSTIATPEKYRSPFGQHVTGHPIGYGFVLAVGPKADGIHPGDYVLLHPLNMNSRKLEEVEYYFPRKAAVYMCADEELS